MVALTHPELHRALAALAHTSGGLTEVIKMYTGRAVAGEKGVCIWQVDVLGRVTTGEEAFAWEKRTPSSTLEGARRLANARDAARSRKPASC